MQAMSRRAEEYSDNLLENRLLAAMPDVVRNRIFSGLESVLLPLGKVISESGDDVRHVYFPRDAIVSLLYVMRDGASAEISIVGNDGMVGFPLIMGGISTPMRAVVQSGGHAFRLSAQKFTEEFSRSDAEEFRVLLLRATQSLITQMSQTAVCNRHHSVSQQLCRWLLMSFDRVPGGTQLVMTQELIANMLGVRREGVTEAARKLQKSAVIRYARGHIELLDRAKLEKMSCECYAVVKKESDRLQARSDLSIRH